MGFGAQGQAQSAYGGSTPSYQRAATNYQRSYRTPPPNPYASGSGGSSVGGGTGVPPPQPGSTGGTTLPPTTNSGGTGPAPPIPPMTNSGGGSTPSTNAGAPSGGPAGSSSGPFTQPSRTPTVFPGNAPGSDPNTPKYGDPNRLLTDQEYAGVMDRARSYQPTGQYSAPTLQQAMDQYGGGTANFNFGQDAQGRNISPLDYLKRNPYTDQGRFARLPGSEMAKWNQGQYKG